MYLIALTAAAIMLSLASQSAANNCRNRLDLVFVIDATSSGTDSSFKKLKDEVTSIASAFKIGHERTRLALVRVDSRQGEVVAKFDQINSHADFQNALDRVRRSPGPVNMAAGMSSARHNLLTLTRSIKISVVLLLVKDMRPGTIRVTTRTELEKMKNEAKAVRETGALLQAIGVGALWFKAELEAIFGTEYQLYKNQNKALESVKSLNNLVCEADCPNAGKSSINSGSCFKSTRQVQTVGTHLTTDSGGLSVCRKEISTSFEVCSSGVACNQVNRHLTSCDTNGRLKVIQTWQVYNFRSLECVTNKMEHEVDCKDSLKCIGQIADVIFILDRSSSMHGLFNYEREAARHLIRTMDIGQDRTWVGLMFFETTANLTVGFTQGRSMDRVIRALDGLPELVPWIGYVTKTHLALDMAAEHFRSYGRVETQRFVFLITDGVSTDPQMTFNSAANIKRLGVTIISIGVGNVSKIELDTLAAPYEATNSFILSSMPQLEAWSVKFSNRICTYLVSPDSRLCDDGAIVQSVSVCEFNKQQVTTHKFVYDSKRQCIRTVRVDVFEYCREKCIDPVNGNEYFVGDNWSSLCHNFQCRGLHQPFLPTQSRCLDASGGCHEVGSNKFNCKDETGAVVANCQCQNVKGKPTLVIDTY